MSASTTTNCSWDRHETILDLEFTVLVWRDEEITLVKEIHTELD